MKTHEEIRRMHAGRSCWSLGCDSGMHGNVGRCPCEGGEWREEDGRYSFWLPGADDPLYVEDIPPSPVAASAAALRRMHVAWSERFGKKQHRRALRRDAGE